MRLYRLLTGPDDSTFCHKISKALHDGWELYGDPSFAFDSNAGQMRCAQAVTKHPSGQTYTPDMKLGEQ
jgi:hypothetical protein